MIRLTDLARNLGTYCEDNFTFDASRICTDTRTLEAGDIYLAIVGERFDGHEFVPQAVSAGASALIVNRPYKDIALPQLIVSDTLKALGEVAKMHRSLFKGTLIAVTGSCGKTSVKEMLRCILSGVGKTFATQGNYNNHIGVPLSLLKLNQDDEFAVLELGTSAPGEIKYLVDLVEPQVALVTNIKSSHLEGLGTLENIAREKASIYTGLNASGLAVINCDENFSSVLRQSASHCQQMNVGLSDKNELYAKKVSIKDNGSVVFDLIYGESSIPINLAVLGKHNVSNALLAAGAALSVGIGLSDIQKGLESFSGVKSRMQARKGINNALVIDDTYNANPGSVKAAIDYLSSLNARTILVLSDMGELGQQSLEAHREIGEYARNKNISNVFAVGDFVSETVKSFGECGKYFESKEYLIQGLEQELSNSIIVLVKGSRYTHMEEIVDRIADDQNKYSPDGSSHSEVISQC